MKRRAFIEKAGLATAGLALGSKAVFGMRSKKTSADIGIQLYTLRSELTKDLPGTIAKVAEIGFRHVETYYGYTGPNASAGFWGLDAKQFKALLQKNGLVSHSGHYQLNEYLTPGDGNDTKLKSQMDVAAATGQQYFVLPVPPRDLWDKLTADHYQFMAAQLNKAGEWCKKSNMSLAYHNHFWEFRNFANGASGYDTLLKETDPSLVSFELDLFWAVKAGQDPIALFKAHPGRFSMWHVKDIDKMTSGKITGAEFDTKPVMDILTTVKFAEVGSGSVDFKNIFAQADAAGMKYFFVEQDGIYMEDKFASIRQSFNYLQQHILHS